MSEPVVIPISDPLTRLQMDIVAKLQAEPFFATLLILAEHKGVSDDQQRIACAHLIDAHPNSGHGAAVIILMPDCHVTATDSPGPLLEIEIVVHVMEYPLINRGDGGTNLAAERIGLEVLKALHQWIPGGFVQQLYAGRDALIPLEPDDEGAIHYLARLRTRFRLNQGLKCETVAIGGDAATGVTMACSTPASQIFYTVDGSFPGPSAIPYPGAAIQNLAAGTLVRAAAYIPNQHGSDIAAETIN